VPWAAALRGYALALSERAEDGVPLLERALAQAPALPFLFGHAQWTAWLAHAHLLAGRPSDARRHADEALRLSRQRGTRGHEAWALYVLGEIEARSGAAGSVAAESFAREALALARVLGMRPLAERSQATLDRVSHEREAEVGPGLSPRPSDPLRSARPG
jgi:tetratricopeptide (TPR) repeat protein